jgi:hypothetical protein
MLRHALISTCLAVVLLGLAACGSTPTERGITGAGIGGAAGAAVGAPITGAVVGGAAGVFTDKDDINLGEPIWKW